MKQRTVILGAGFAGIQTALELEPVLGGNPQHEIVLVNDTNFFLFTPLLPEIASSYINPRHIVQPIRDIRGRRNFEFRRDDVRSIDVAARRVMLAGGPLEYTALVVALGSEAEYFGVPGAREFTFDYKTLEQAVVLRDHVIDCCEHAEHVADAATRARLVTFVVVGGGYTGVEIASELQDFLFGYVVSRYRRLPRSEIRLVVLEAAPEILRGVHPSLAGHAAKYMRKEGIELRTGARVTRCLAAGVEINGAETIHSETVIWASGVRAHRLVASLPGPHDRIGRCVVNEFLQLEGHPEVFIAGDSSAATTALDAPRVAPVAIQHGKIAAKNIAAIAAGGGAAASYKYEPMGMLVSLGMNYAVVDLGGLKFSGYFAWLFWNAVHLFKLVGFKKQIQVALDWMLASVFPRDASIVRRPRNCKFCDPPQAASHHQ